MKRKVETVIVRGVYAVTVAGCLLAVAELGLRLFGAGERPDPLAGREAMEAYSYFDWRQAYFADARRAGFGYAYEYEPFSLWKHKSFASQTFNVEDGYRVTWKPEPAETTFTVYAFGGSTLFGAEGPDEHTIPSYLAKKLNCVVRSYAVSGFTSDNEVHLLVRLLRDGHRPDAVVFYDGVNDVHYKAYLGVPHYLYENFHRLGAVGARDLLDRVAGRSRLLSLLRGRRSRPAGVRDRTVLQERMPAVLDEYLGNVELVRALGAGYGFESHFFWQTTLFGTGKTLTGEEEGLREKYEAFAAPYEVADAAVGEALERHGIHDLRRVLDGVRESIFVDFCHTTAIGNEAVASAMAGVVAGGGE